MNKIILIIILNLGNIYRFYNRFFKTVARFDKLIRFRILKKGPYKVQDFLMFIEPEAPMYNELVIGNGYHEKCTTNLINNYLKDGMTFIDVGANIGYFTLVAARKVEKNGRVFSFEPELENFDLLSKNVELNRLNNITFENIALSNLEGEIVLNKDPNSKGRHSICISREGWVPIRCKAMRLDAYFKKTQIHIKQIDFIKIDAEGAELAILKGMENLIDPKKTLILLEFSKKLIIESGSTVKDFVDYLSEIGYDRATVINEKLQEKYVVDMSKLLSLEDGTYNLLLSNTKNLSSNKE
ncbi:MAG: hypothetical protein BRC41_11990 [Cyanobacteria bacterium QH_9_48_43]|nr:MAG: hypothetical protein BRC41_11990 [Cyanobacteria bacterium QH_9_48_43]